MDAFYDLFGALWAVYSSWKRANGSSVKALPS